MADSKENSSHGGEGDVFQGDQPAEAFGKELEKITATLGAILKNVEETADSACALLEAHQTSLGFFTAWRDALIEKSDDTTEPVISTDGTPKKGGRSTRPEEHSDAQSRHSDVF